MNSTRSPEKVHPGIALALLTSLRDQDTPDEAIEDEAFAHSLPRRLGLNDVINVQMHRYADLKEAGRSLALSEFLDLVRLISRRPDAVEIFRRAGTALAAERFAETGALRRAARRLSTEKARRRKLRRSMTRAAKALTPGAAIEADRDPPGMIRLRARPGRHRRQRVRDPHGGARLLRGRIVGPGALGSACRVPRPWRRALRLAGDRQGRRRRRGRRAPPDRRAGRRLAR